MSPFLRLLRDNPNYRWLWLGQVVSEVGDHFNTVAVLSLAERLTGSGVVVSGVLIARTLPIVLAGPLAGVLLDRMDRRHIMIASDLFRAAVACGFLLVPRYPEMWLIYLLCALLMFGSPFFTSGRAAILPRIAGEGELATANTLTQTTSWLTLSLGTFLGGVGVAELGHEASFGFNIATFLFSGLAIGLMRSPTGSFRAERRQQATTLTGDFGSNLRYMARTPLVLAITVATVGWAAGGGAAQLLFTLIGQRVLEGGSRGIGTVWGSAGLGLVAGGLTAYWLIPRLGFASYKRAIGIAITLHGLTYMAFSQSPTVSWAALWIFWSRVGMGISNVLNRMMLLTHVPDSNRGRVFATMDSLQQAVLMTSLMVAGVATTRYEVRTVALVAGCLSASTAVWWWLLDATGRISEPDRAQ